MATDTVNILGHPVKKRTATIGAVAAGGVIVVAVYRKKQAAAAAAAAGSTTAATGTAMVTDPGGASCAALDPATGYCPGTPGDVAAQQGAAAYNGGLDASGGVSYFEPTGTSSGSTVPTFLDNGSWAQYVEQALGSTGEDATAAAIAKYLNGQQVTSAQQSIIEEAIAIANYPPVPGSGGFPPSIKLGTDTGGGSGSVAAPAGVKASPAGKGAASIHWDKVTGATSYHIEVTHQGSAAGSANATGTSHTVNHLSPGLSYGFRVAAVGSGGQGPYSDVAYANAGK